MKPAHHHAHDHDGHAPPFPAPRSLLLASAWQRLLGAAALLALLWGAVAWALQP